MNIINSKFGKVDIINNLKYFLKNISFNQKEKYIPTEDSNSNIKIIFETQEIDENGNLCIFQKQLITTPEGEEKINYSYTIR